MRVFILIVCLLISSCSNNYDNYSPYRSQAWKVYKEIDNKSQIYSLADIKSMLGEPTIVEDKYMWQQGKSFLVIKFDEKENSISAYWGDNY